MDRTARIAALERKLLARIATRRAVVLELYRLASAADDERSRLAALRELTQLTGARQAIEERTGQL
ncbi:MAG: hypothetical protein GC190_20470 [Alphaproteobacteria bacterium]|nr:hypothetical protein [Alphaproteobacteria bacterium]